MIESFISYMRTLHFSVPEASRRYYRLFGDLEYDQLALRAENKVMVLRIREVKRRMARFAWVSEEDERQISITSHELAEYFYTRLETLKARMATARSFTFDATAERQSRLLLADIAHAILGLRDAARRDREQPTLDRACGAYAILDIPELLDIHEQVQNLLAHERREQLEESEELAWRRKQDELSVQHPLPHCARLDDPAYITRKTEGLKRSILREQNRLEQLGLTYTSAVRSMRFRN